MAITSIKSTYALDVISVQKLEQLAKGWGVSKSEALRRAIRAAADAKQTESTSRAIGALENLQLKVRLDSKQAAEWIRNVKSERHATAKKRIK